MLKKEERVNRKRLSNAITSTAAVDQRGALVLTLASCCSPLAWFLCHVLSSALEERVKRRRVVLMILLRWVNISAQTLPLPPLTSYVLILLLSPPGKIAFLHTELEGILTGVEGNPFTKFKHERINPTATINKALDFALPEPPPRLDPFRVWGP